MLKSGLLNPAIHHLLARFRHTNRIVIADRGFPFWPQVETIDLSLTDDIPRVTDVLRAVLPLVSVGAIWMAEEFQEANGDEITAAYQALFAPVRVEYEVHVELKRKVPSAIGLIRTADTTPYSNVILESA